MTPSTLSRVVSFLSPAAPIAWLGLSGVLACMLIARHRLHACCLPDIACMQADCPTPLACRWVHSKAPSRSLGNQHGHQMHFDTEEGVLYSSGLLHHPCVSSVIYLSGATVAGPTVVLACMLIALPTCMQDDCPTDEPLMSH